MDEDLREALALLRKVMDTKVEDSVMILNAIGRMTRAEAKHLRPDVREIELERKVNALTQECERLREAVNMVLELPRAIDGDHGNGDMFIIQIDASELGILRALTTKPEDTNAK